jgi:hypothetical protein
MLQCASMRRKIVLSHMPDHTLLDRRRDAARKLAVSESQVLKWEREGLLRRIEVPGIRAVRYSSAEVDALGKRFIAEAKESE